MNITILQDNTVHVRYRSGESQTINSTHAHKALSPIVEAVAKALPYKGAMEFTADYTAPTFSFDSLECTGGNKAFEAAIGPFMAELTELKAAFDGEEDQPITKTEMRPEQKVEMIDGAAVMVTTEVPHEVPQYDEFPITDGTGQPVLELVSAATEDADAVYKQAVHKVAKMKKGKKVSATKKKRLAKLLATG